MSKTQIDKGFKISPKLKRLKSMLILTAFSSCKIFAQAPEFDFLTLHGLPRKFVDFYTQNDLYLKQLVDIDGDLDNDAVFVRNADHYLLLNAGNLVAPAFEKTAQLIANPLGSPFIFGDINGNDAPDMLGSSLRTPSEAIIYLDVDENLSSNITDRFQALSFEDLVGAEEAERIRELTDLFSPPIKFSDFDGDGDLDLEIFYSPVYLKGSFIRYSQSIKIENTGSINGIPFYVAISEDSDFTFADTDPKVLHNIQYKALYGIDSEIPFDSHCADFAIKSDLFSSINLSYDSRFIDVSGDEKSDLALVSRSIIGNLTNGLLYSDIAGIYNYHNNSLNILTDQFSNLTFRDQPILGDINSDGVIDVMELPHSLSGYGYTINEENSRLYLLSGVSLSFKEWSLCQTCPSVFQSRYESSSIDYSSLSKLIINDFSENTLYTYALVDINGDKKDDLFVNRYISETSTNTTRLFLNQGFDSNGKLKFSAPIANPFGLIISSFVTIEQIDGDLDGDQDIFINEYNLSNYFENIGTNDQPLYEKRTILPFSLIDTFENKFSDLDGDGDLDAYTSSYNGPVQINNQINDRDDQVAHISIRAYSEAEEGRIIGGFEVLGPRPQRVIIKGIGPSLAEYGVEKPLPDPVLTLFEGQQPIKVNDDWQSAADGGASIKNTPFAPPNANEAVLDVELKPGIYTVHLTDKSGQSGIGIVSIDTPIYGYLDSPRPKQRSFRLQIGNGEDVAIAGFVVQDGPKQIVIHGIGPSLTAEGVENPLDDPELLLFSGSKLIASNQSWRSLTNRDLLTRNQLAPRDNREAVIMQNLDPGTYTVHLRSQTGGQGVGIIGISTLQ